MRFLAYLTALLAIVALTDATREQLDGHAKIFRRPGQIREEFRTEDTEAYRNLMAYQWIRAAAATGLSLFIFSQLRRANRLEPFSPTFQGKESIEKLGADLEADMKE